jgi:hypothetical protein
MPDTYPGSPKLLKGALVSFGTKLIGPIPTVIVFQYNPERLSRKLDIWAPATKTDPQTSNANTNPSAQPRDPTESFTLDLEFDAADSLEDPSSYPVEAATGIADRIAALEMLIYPVADSLIGGLLSSIGGSLGSVTGLGSGSSPNNIPDRPSVSVLLFVWGPGRIVPVRITSFSVEEQAFSPLLYPIRAKVSIGMQIIPSGDITGTDFASELAATCYDFTKTQKEALAAANTLNSVQSILGMLPI